MLPTTLPAVQAPTHRMLFVSHAYETMFLVRERESDLMRVERLERARLQSELGALKAQVDPHFLFNSLNTLGHLISSDAQRGREFCDALAEVYRCVLASREHDLVALADELAFVRRYHRLLGLRFGQAMQLDVGAELDRAALSGAARVVPLAQISHLVSLDKLTYAVAMDGVRYLVEQTLSELEAELDPARFFRVNRQLLVAARAVRHYSPAGKGRLKVSIESGAADEAFVSQERAADFKAWLQAAPIAG